MIASDDGQKLFLGIDPGQSGGLAILNDAGLVVDVSGMDRESANARAFENWFAGSSANVRTID
jgi:predicted RNase H-like nuclease (RuvC/YqgF family)